jgi:hypothetical protein
VQHPERWPVWFLRWTDFNFVVETKHSCDALTAIDAELTFVKRIHPPRYGYNSRLRIDFDRSQACEMPVLQKSLHSPFQIAVCKRDRLIFHKDKRSFPRKIDWQVIKVG